jgi:hypothetical protein
VVELRMALQAALGYRYAHAASRPSSRKLDFEAVGFKTSNLWGWLTLFGRLPELQGEVDRLLEQVNDDISNLPLLRRPPSQWWR